MENVPQESKGGEQGTVKNEEALPLQVGEGQEPRGNHRRGWGPTTQDVRDHMPHRLVNNFDMMEIQIIWKGSWRR